MAGAGASAGVPPKRLSTAAQFFAEDDQETETFGDPPKKTTYDRVVELLNQASLMSNELDKISNLKQVQELIIHKDPTLLDNFLDEMIAFQNDRSIDVKRCIIGFMEEACKKDAECLVRVIQCIAHLLQDENVNVQKKVILSFAGLYRCALQWVCKAKTVSPEMTAIWEQVNQIKATLAELIDSDNDGIRTHVVKFLEGLTLVLSKKTPASEIPKKQGNELCLDHIVENGRLIRLKKLEEEGQQHFLTLVQFQGSPHISSINLMTVMGALTNIAKQRPTFFDQVVQSFEALHVNLPPTLAKSQVSSVRKNLKMQMMALLRHSMSADFVPQITTLLTDLGASQHEINKALPKDESRKRKPAEDPGSSSKKAKVEPLPEIDDDDMDDIGITPWVDRSKSKQTTPTQRQTAIDVTAEDLLPRLSVQHVADLVLLSMVMLPDSMPALFQSTYTPIAAAGTDSQIKHISRLLATQLTMAGMGKGVGELKLQAMKKAEQPADGSSPAHDDGGTSPKQLIQTVVGGMTAREEEEHRQEQFKKEFVAPIQAPPPRKGMRQFKLESVTKPLHVDELDKMTVHIFKRILNAERVSAMNHILGSRIKILAGLTSQFGGPLKDMLEDHIFADLRGRYDLAFSWLYQEYANCQGFNSASGAGKTDMSSYDECLTRLLKTLSEQPDQKDGLFHRLILEAPVITTNAMQIIRRYCANEVHTEAGMNTLRDLIVMRPKSRLDFLDLMLTFTASERTEIRNPAIQTAQKLYENPQLRPCIETYAVKQLKLLLIEKPEDVKRPLGTAGEPDGWTDDGIKANLYLYLGLLPNNHALIHELANIYTATSADIKRTILRVLEGPVKGMGMDSPELLTLVENCPKGSETLVMRVIHILTDKAVPSPELVDRIRDLYHKRVPDVRFLIPVLNGLSKKEVISALPKLIKLNPMVVKEVFNRLMGAHITANASYVSPLTPDELLVALHNIDPNKCDMKTIIKAANMCFSERTIYTQEVLAIVMQRLMEQSPLPTLLMRTVIQSLSMYPRLIGFVVNILQRLIIKQVWHQKKVWEGFIKCCQRTKPQSFQVLLQLPPVQLTNVFQVSPDLRMPLLQHVQSFTAHQMAHIPHEIMRVLETEPVPEPEHEPEPAPPAQQPDVEPPPPGVVAEFESSASPSTAAVSKPPSGEPRPISTITADRRAAVQTTITRRLSTSSATGTPIAVVGSSVPTASKPAIATPSSIEKATVQPSSKPAHAAASTTPTRPPVGEKAGAKVADTASKVLATKTAAPPAKAPQTPPGKGGERKEPAPKDASKQPEKQTPQAVPKQADRKEQVPQTKTRSSEKPTQVSVKQEPAVEESRGKVVSVRAEPVLAPSLSAESAAEPVATLASSEPGSQVQRLRQSSSTAPVAAEVVFMEPGETVPVVSSGSVGPAPVSSTQTGITETPEPQLDDSHGESADKESEDMSTEEAAMPVTPKGGAKRKQSPKGRAGKKEETPETPETPEQTSPELDSDKTPDEESDSGKRRSSRAAKAPTRRSTRTKK